MPTDLSRLRNFCIIAHIDHGKSTLADRLLDLTHAVSERNMRAQYLDKMDLERERGITIKAQAVRLGYAAADGREYVLNLIDTPGHVDFTYEVSRALAACEGAVLLVDAAQGIEAQTLANLYLAVEADLTIIPVINKIDLPAAQPDRVAREIEQVLGTPASEMLRVSAKTGEGVPDLLEAIVRRVPPPTGDPEAPARALVFDSLYDSYRGVIAYVRMVDGRLSKNDRARMMAAGHTSEAEEVGVFAPEAVPTAELQAGEVGYLIPGVKDVRQVRVGDTVTTASRPAAEPLGGYREPRPMVFSGLYPIEGDDFPDLRDALDRLRLNDAALVYEPESSTALGFGFRCGFLGLLHMDIVRERLEREFDLALITTAPNVAYRVTLETGETIMVSNPSELPPAGSIQRIEEPYVSAMVLCPADYIGPVMELCQGRRGELVDHGVPVRGAGRAALPAPPRRDHLRLLRPAEVADPRVRLARLRAQRVPGGRPGQGRRAPPGRAGRRLLGHRPQGQGVRLRPGDDGQAQAADPAPALRGPDPGDHRGQGDRPRDHHRPAQGRARQMLRRRRHPQAQAAGTPEGRQAADEADRPGRGPPGGVRRRPED